jgi:hypothetical protein
LGEKRTEIFLKKGLDTRIGKLPVGQIGRRLPQACLAASE